MKATSIIAALCVVLTLAACDAPAGPKGGGRFGGGRPDIPRTDPLVEVDRARRDSIPMLERSTGRVEARNLADVYSQVSEIALEVRYDVGDFVERDALLVRLRSDESLLRMRSSQLALQEAELVHSRNILELDKRRSELERIERHFDPQAPETSRIFTREAFEAAKLEYDKAVNTVQAGNLALDKARGDVAAAALLLSHTDVKAPISGFITQRNVRANELVGANTLLYQITDFSVLEVRLDVAEARLASMREPERLPGVSVLGLDEKVRVGSAQAALLSITAFPRERFLGYLDRIQPTVDEARGMVVVIVRVIQPADVDSQLHAPLLEQFDRGSRRAVLATADAARQGARLMLRPGMWVDARIATQHIENALLIPGAAIVGDAEIIWVVARDPEDPDSGTVRSVSISGRRGVSAEGFVELTPPTVVAQPRERPQRPEGATQDRKGERRGKGRAAEPTGSTDVEEGTLIVVRGQALLRDGQRVRMREVGR